MGKIVKVILDDLPHHPLHKMWLELAEKIAKELGVELEVKKEDYVFAMEHGDTDDLGMTWLPQLFVQLEDGSVKLVMSQFPFDPATGKSDPDKAYEEAKSKVEAIARDP
ncbi:hypothetical protein [Aeropyrum camini]|uniref:Uncharacterized protein n=1 Tax=Aeropyrum camini SY1 = JCM 12091 TaxID=1198449 RepID=U3THH2_9CREN|nr:hypothetical protein [Aeropyrum camini]BAN90784.1 hypothetical protein ACAM_1315 [Aeropyrum camini SY1 = JCM 12091]